jgi:hypothetical protein
MCQHCCQDGFHVRSRIYRRYVHRARSSRDVPLMIEPKNPINPEISCYNFAEMLQDHQEN